MSAQYKGLLGAHRWSRLFNQVSRGSYVISGDSAYFWVSALESLRGLQFSVLRDPRARDNVRWSEKSMTKWLLFMSLKVRSEF